MGIGTTGPHLGCDPNCLHQLLARGALEERGLGVSLDAVGTLRHMGHCNRNQLLGLRRQRAVGKHLAAEGLESFFGLRRKVSTLFGKFTDFAHHHELSFPEDNNRGFFVGLGPLALTYILEAGGSGCFRQHVVAPYITAGKLHLAAGAPSFFYPVCAVCSAQADDELIDLALDELRNIASVDPVEPRSTAINPLPL